ncbi:hypothetical protein DFJ58DRAFT_734313 [Suillus subalutaceus]|uniref:uncharacterized protein n=1 Tax=Suillus subalutaceus TaxID=48586 RepID=UPI001B871E29|nr:uncharacterized protein DFJ58DRAFT_734313 [Suillus subalutaceus]KAG1837503.1 hypothetical protein DFJ58DRAFT_734313 [Suillus subalutaceus]
MFPFTPTLTPTATPTDDSDAQCDHSDNFVQCGGLAATIILAVVFLPCYTAILWCALCSIVLCVRSALRAICTVLFGRALNVQLESMEDDGVHEGGGTSIPLVFCGTWMRPPSPTQEAVSMDQSEWSSVQPVSVSVSSQVTSKSALGMGTSESAVSADASTRVFPNDSKSSSSILNSPEAAMVAVMIRMPSPVLRCCMDRECPSYSRATSDHALSEYQIGVAQVHLSTRMQSLCERLQYVLWERSLVGSRKQA